jgi:hypothetical protein
MMFEQDTSMIKLDKRGVMTSTGTVVSGENTQKFEAVTLCFVGNETEEVQIGLGEARPACRPTGMD